MKRILITVVLVLIVSLWMVGRSDWHLNRNQYNKTPKGNLKTIVKDEIYEDEEARRWELQPAIKNKFHQPDHEVEMVNNPYPNLEYTKPFDPKNPNLKFLSKTADGGSYEVIMQPDGTYLTEGVKMGTYNYGHPSGFFGILKHTFLDVIPHFVNSKYKN